MKTNFITKGETTPNAFIAKSKQRVKQFGDTVYLKNNDEFQIELYNPTQNKVLAKIEVNGKSIGNSGLVLRPGERVFLERFLDDAKKFKFETYSVENNNKNLNAIKNNGDVKISFYNEFVYNLLTSTNTSHIYTYYEYNTVPTIMYYSGNEVMCNGNINYAANTVNGVTTSSASYTLTGPTIETGRVESGGNSNQNFEYDYSNYSTSPIKTITWKILPESRKEVTIDDIVLFCQNCGRKRKGSKENYCPKCGNKF